MDWKDDIRKFADLLKNIRPLFLVGRGASLATVGIGALIVKESDHFHAEGMSSAALRHGPFEMLGNDTLVLVSAGDAKTQALNQRLLHDIRQQDGRADLVDKNVALSCGRIAEYGPSVRQIMEILLAEMITLALQAGCQPGRFELASKVTTIELRGRQRDL